MLANTPWSDISLFQFFARGAETRASLRLVSLKGIIRHQDELPRWGENWPVLSRIQVLVRDEVVKVQPVFWLRDLTNKGGNNPENLRSETLYIVLVNVSVQGILYVEDVGVEVPSGGVRVGEEVPESLQGDLAKLSVVLCRGRGAEANILKLEVWIVLRLQHLPDLTVELLVWREVHSDPRGEEAGGEVLHGVDPPVPEEEVEAHPHEAGAQPHHSVSAEEVERVEGAFQFVEVLGDLHVLVRRKPIPRGGDQIGKKPCRILTEI